MALGYLIVQTVIFLCREAALSLEPFPREPHWVDKDRGKSIDIHKKGKNDY